jgi:ketosteroid isomerase-like protein
MKPAVARRSAIALLAAFALASPLAHSAQPEVDPAAATADLYARISARDLPGLLRYLPAAGFTEIGPNASAPRTLAPSAFEALFASGLSIALHAEDVRVQRYGDAAIVTGVRVGTIGSKDAPPPGERDPFTMVWTRDANGWRLRHLHLSAPKSSQ